MNFTRNQANVTRPSPRRWGLGTRLGVSSLNPWACGSIKALLLLVKDYKLIGVNNEFHNITLSCMIEVPVLASALFQ